MGVGFKLNPYRMVFLLGAGLSLIALILTYALLRDDSLDRSPEEANSANQTGGWDKMK